MNEYSKCLMETAEEFPNFRIVRKSDSSFMKFLNVFVGVFNKTFMDSYVTTIGRYMWVPDAWDEWSDQLKAALLRHERVHLRQQKRYGMLSYAFRYLLWPVPFFYAKGRRDLEMEAYAESLRAYCEYYGASALEDAELRERTIGHFTSGEYAWMWTNRKDIEEWYDVTVAETLGD